MKADDPTLRSPEEAPPAGDVLAPDEADEPDDGPPRAWHRHDLVVVLAALALLAAGRLAYQTQARPRLVELAHHELRLARPAGWLVPAPVDQAPVPLAAGLDGEPARAPVAPVHVVYGSPAPPLTSVEVRIGPRPQHGNLLAALGFLRRSRYGELYRSVAIEVISVGERDWLRTRFRYASKPDKQASPRVATGIEYATVHGAHLYAVTVHGDDLSARRLAELIAPTLAIHAEGAPERLRPEAPILDEPELRAATQATVALLAVDRVGGGLEPVSGGSGVIVAADGWILTSAHVLHDERRDRLHDLFVVGRFRGPDREPELICAGLPARGMIDARLDLALIRCDRDMDGRAWTPRHWPAVPIGRSSAVAPGEPVRVLGYPDRGGGNLQIDTGAITGWSRDGDDYLQTSAEIEPGSSGGAVIDEQGALIGLATAYRVRAEILARDPAQAEASEPRTITVERIGLVRPIDHAAHLLAMAAGIDAPVRADPAAPATPRPEPAGNGVLVASRVVDAANDHPIAGAMVIVLAPGINARDLDLHRLGEHAVAWGQTTEDGEFLFEKPLVRGHRYTVAVLAEGYRPLVGDGALLLAPGTPDFFDPWGVIRVARH